MDMKKGSPVTVVLGLATLLFGTVILIVFFWVSQRAMHPRTLFSIPISVSFDIKANEADENGPGKTYLKIEWNPITARTNFHQRDVLSADSRMESFVIKVDDTEAVGLSFMNTTQTFCTEDDSLPEWVGILRHVMLANQWRQDTEAHECQGITWNTNHNGNPIQICIYDDQLDYVTHLNSRAEVTTWTKTDKQNIRIMSDVMNGPCQNVSRVNNITPSKVRKVKRDSGVPEITCVFVHGSGQENSSDNMIVHSNMMGYWGNIRNYTSKCSSHKFLQLNSIDHGWDADSLHQLFCRVAAPNGTISDTIIFTHSMGNLLVAAALYRNYCTFNTTSSRWFSVQGPWTGTVVADLISNICTSPSLIQQPARILFRMLGWYCKSSEESEFESYKTLKTNYISPTGISYDNLTEVGQNYVSGVMCGTSFYGQGRSYQESLAFSFIEYFSYLEHPNDGMVSFTSCKLTNVPFGNRSVNAYYKGPFNHADGTCKNGGDSCMWYHNMLERI
ncbi:uncharacterized protein [Argopecten irradians]|uniref:uncharacterized protein n=1 Tax=Argopecten irradians TaxID=31199 RepID=UPI003722731C